MNVSWCFTTIENCTENVDVSQSYVRLEPFEWFTPVSGHWNDVDVLYIGIWI